MKNPPALVEASLKGKPSDFEDILISLRHNEGRGVALENALAEPEEEAIVGEVAFEQLHNLQGERGFGETVPRRCGRQCASSWSA